MLFYYWNCCNTDYYYLWLGADIWTTDRHMDGPTDRQTLLPIKLLLLLEFKKIWLLKLVVTLFYFVCQYYQNSWLQTEIPSNIANCRATIAAKNQHASLPSTKKLFFYWNWKNDDTFWNLWLQNVDITLFCIANYLCQHSWLHTQIPFNIAIYRAAIAASNYCH